MSDQRVKPRPRGDIEFLARQWQVPIQEVTRLYEGECAALAVNAQVTAYLPIIAIRNVRETLRRRRDVSRNGRTSGAHD
ncbi:MAG: DUF3562 domain-containing protein [Gammaproteobacteria bacterium]|nr:DUF3562 domain-containing protein [Gammaproteobacteria bacterium]